MRSRSPIGRRDSTRSPIARLVAVLMLLPAAVMAPLEPAAVAVNEITTENSVQQATGNLLAPSAKVVCGEDAACTSIFGGSVTGTPVPGNQAVELGVKFRSDVAGEILGIRFYKTDGDTGTHTGTLWNTAGGRLATVTFSGESASGWQEAAFSTPVAIEPDTTYVASYHTASGYYVTGTSLASAGVDSPPLHALQNGVDGANGVFVYGTGGVFPANTYQSSNYLADVVFSEMRDMTAPTVTLNAPAANATDVSVHGDVAATFSEPVDAATISATTVQLLDPSGNLVDADVSYDSEPSCPEPRRSTPRLCIHYTAVIKGGDAGVRDLAGIPLTSDYSWGFTTSGPDETAPTIVSTAPAEGSTGALIGADVKVAFSELMDAASINASTIELHDDATGALIDAAVSYDAATSSATLNPSASLAYATRYTVIVRSGMSGVLDLVGNPLAEDYLLSFTTGGVDTAPPVITSTWPTVEATAFGVEANVTAFFSEPMAASSINATTVQLRNASGNLVGAVISYDPGTQSLSIDPSNALAYGTDYTATVTGGSGGVTDVAGNPMAADFTWSFTTITQAGRRPSPDVGPGGPVLVVKGTGVFGGYLPEILRSEGLNLFTVRTTSSLTAIALASYETVVLGETALTASQVTALTDWVNAGGNLIAMRPTPALADLLGLAVVTGTLSEGYIKVDTSTEPGKGIESATMQFHGSAGLYSAGAETQVVATLYSGATTPTNYPAVTLRSVGSAGGSAAAFTYDLARSVVYTRQGNPAWAHQERDGEAGLRAAELFYPNYVDMSKVAIPQADEQQRLLANVITETTRDALPLPRFWYLPRGEVAAIVMTADEHNGGSVPSRFNKEISQSASSCGVGLWECIRSTS